MRSCVCGNILTEVAFISALLYETRKHTHTRTQTLKFINLLKQHSSDSGIYTSATVHNCLSTVFYIQNTRISVNTSALFLLLNQCCSSI